MILALSLLVASMSLLLAGPAVLRRTIRPSTRPLLAISGCLAASWGAVVGVAVAAALFAFPWLAALAEFPASIEACLRTVRVSDHAGSATSQVAGATVLVLLAFRLGICSLRIRSVTHERRTRQRVLLTLVARRDAALGIDIVEHTEAVVYCVPGHGGRIVFTSSALRTLSSRQRSAVLAHERAHLAGRHDILIACAALLHHAFPCIGLFSLAHQHVTRLVEIRADDIAARRHGRRSIVEALVALSQRCSPAGTLAATGVFTSARIERLVTGPPPVDRSLRGVGRGAAIIVAGAAFVSFPVLLAFVSHVALCAV